MKALLDTNALVWAILMPSRLKRKAAEFIGDSRNEKYISAISALEIATKVRIGKFSLAEPFEREYLELVERAGFLTLPVTTPVALQAGRLPASHGDPFDRVLASHALLEQMPIVSPDIHLDAFGVRRIW